MSFTTASARELAMSALLYIVERQELAAGFLGSSGLRPEDLRSMAGSPELGLHVLDYLLEDDSRVLDAAGALALRPQDLLAARTALAGPGSYGWEAD